jgi:hypothetical protein
MQCNEAQGLISDSIDARLDPRLRTIFEAHLASCSTCRSTADLLNRTNRLFSSLPQAEPPVGFTTRLMAHVQDEAAKPNLWKWLSLPFQLGVPIQATAVVLVAVLAVFLYQKESLLQSPTQETPAGPLLEKKEASEQYATQQAQGMQQEQQRQAQPLSDLSQQLQGQQQTPGPSSTQRPFGSDSPVAGAGSEYSRAGGEQTVDHRLVVRLRTPVDSGQLAEDRSQSQAGPGSVLSQQDAKNLEQARQRAMQTGQPHSDLFSIPRDRYEQFTKELAAIGAIQADPGSASQKSESSEKRSDSLLIMVTIFPPPPQPGVR